MTSTSSDAHSDTASVASSGASTGGSPSKDQTKTAHLPSHCHVPAFFLDPVIQIELSLVFLERHRPSATALPSFFFNATVFFHYWLSLGCT